MRCMREIKYLTQTEVNNLKAGVKVIITWSSGNGPHEYIIHKREGQNASFVSEHNPNAGWYDGKIDFVGKESYHTKVNIAPPIK